MVKFMKKLFILICLLFCLLQPAYGKESGPETVINQLHKGLITCMKMGNTLEYKKRYEFMESIIKKNFAISYMAKKTLGLHWGNLSRQKQKELLEAYLSWSVASYAGNFSSYIGEVFDGVEVVLFHKNEMAVIKSQLVKSTGEKIEFNYRLKKLEIGWQVVDIMVYGVSQIAIIRLKFDNIIEQQGLTGLIDYLKKNINEFETNK